MELQIPSQLPLIAIENHPHQLGGQGKMIEQEKIFGLVPFDDCLIPLKICIYAKYALHLENIY